METTAKGAVDGNPRARLLLHAEPSWISALELRVVPCPPQRTCEFCPEGMSRADELGVEMRALLGNESSESFVLWEGGNSTTLLLKVVLLKDRIDIPSTL